VNSLATSSPASQISAAAATIAQWVDAVDVQSAPTRVSAMLDQHQALAAEGARRSMSDGCATERICLHEASHAVLACVQGAYVERACVRGDASGGSVVAHYGDDCDAQFTEVVVHLAGAAIELTFLGVDIRRQFELACGYDIAAAALALHAYRIAIPEANSKIFAAAAVCGVASQMDSIRRVAAALKIAGELNGEEVRALCGTPN
jgi:hypothetical protein